MGMFDSVTADCPHCGAEVEMQSKAGDCCLDDYDLRKDHKVPIKIAADIMTSRSASWNTQCDKCKGHFRLKFNSPEKVRCWLEKTEGNEE